MEAYRGDTEGPDGCLHMKWAVLQDSNTDLRNLPVYSKL